MEEILKWIIGGFTFYIIKDLLLIQIEKFEEEILGESLREDNPFVDYTFLGIFRII